MTSQTAPLDASLPNGLASAASADLPNERDPIWLPADMDLRQELHNEVHARPSARIRLPALVVYVAVLNHGVSRANELAHLQKLPGQQHLTLEDMDQSFLRLRYVNHTVKWERHSEFSRYSIVQPMPAQLDTVLSDAQLLAGLMLPADWLSTTPGQTIAAIHLALVHGDLNDPVASVAQGRAWLGEHALVASVMGHNAHSWAMADFYLRPSGFERMMVIAPTGTTEARAGRVSQRLLELETYRIMALRGLPVAKALMPDLTAAEHELAEITSQIDDGTQSDPELLNRLARVAARVEMATATHAYRFAATEAYHHIVLQRIDELHEKPVPGTQTIGEFMNRRLSPAMATAKATAQRLSTLSDRITRASALLRTRVDIVTESQNRQLLEKLTRGQELQLRLQSTVEGLSIAAISYYVISLALYASKAAKAAGLPINPELATGALIPLVLWAVWRTTKRIHDTLNTSA